MSGPLLNSLSLSLSLSLSHTHTHTHTGTRPGTPAGLMAKEESLARPLSRAKSGQDFGLRGWRGCAVLDEVAR